MKEAINLCLKEAVKDSLTVSFTWWGREGGQRPLYNTRIIIAIYGMTFFHFLLLFTINIRIFFYVYCILFAEAVCNNKHFPRPTRSEFQAYAKEALRTAKERARSKLRGQRVQVPNRRNRDFWNDERELEEEVRDNDE